MFATHARKRKHAQRMACIDPDANANETFVLFQGIQNRGKSVLFFRYVPENV